MKRVVVLLAALVLGGWWYLAGLRSMQQRDAAEGRPELSDSERQIGAKDDESNSRAPLPIGGTLPSHNNSQIDPSYFLKGRPNEAVHLGTRPEPGSMALELPAAPEKKRYPGELEARTPEEAVWLDRHGYPTQEELDSLDAMTEMELAEQAARGDLAAMGMLGEKQLRQEKIVEGQSNLNEAAMLGSIWAILTLADWQKRGGNTIAALELYQLAALRGDWASPPLHMQTGLRKEIKTAELYFTPGNVAMLYANMQRLRALRGLPPLGIDTRPNVFNRPGGGDPIGVYPRQRAK
ncbi:MAG: hypothetical protein IPF83_10295 [Rhodanobacteraceae bacterium]|nr:hypothetical protein [Rhodanobacteraceae bacterium]MBP9154454.1 hypothetical protein [Xanthomonadales bacterium]